MRFTLCQFLGECRPTVHSESNRSKKGRPIMVTTSFVERSKIPVFHWSGVIAGLLVALGVYIVCVAFGLGLTFAGNGVLDEEIAGLGLFLWSSLGWSVAAFIGGYVTAWISAASRYGESLFHSLTLWGLMTCVLLLLSPNALGVGPTLAGAVLSPHLISFTSWFMAVGGVLSLGSTIWGGVTGSRVLRKADMKTTDSYRAA